MLALTFQGELSIKLETVPKPELLWDTDVVVRVTSCSICGSDLHPFHGRELGIAKGTIVGHEYVGVVEQVGTKVRAAACPASSREARFGSCAFAPQLHARRVRRLKALCSPATLPVALDAQRHDSRSQCGPSGCRRRCPACRSATA